MKKYLKLTFAGVTALVLFGCGKPPAENPGIGASDLVSSEDADALVDTIEEIRAGQSQTSMESARKKAGALLRAASEKAKNSQARELFQAMQASLGRAKMDVPAPGRDLKACVQDSAVLAFVNLLSPNTIHICARAASANESHLTQVLIHETAHLVGIHDECQATRVEVSVMRASRSRLPFRNGYMQNCGIR